MKPTWLVVATIVALSVATPLVGRGRKASGEILDPQGFKSVHTYCIDVRDLSPHYAQMVKSFFNEQDKPNSLVSEMPWKLVNDCSQADAIMTFKFLETSEIEQASGGGSASAGAVAPLEGGTVQQTWFEVTAVVTDRASQKEVYQVQGFRAPGRGERAMEKTFKALAKDVKSVQL
jgi:hypothetical protein